MDGTARGDLVTLVDEEPDHSGPKPAERLLKDVWTEGKRSGEDNLETARARRRADMARLAPDHLDLVDPAPYPVLRSPGLRSLCDRLLGAGKIGAD